MERLFGVHQTGKIDIDDVPQQIAWSAPFMEFPEEMTVEEVLDFHRCFQKCLGRSIFNEFALSSSGLSGHREVKS